MQVYQWPSASHNHPYSSNQQFSAEKQGTVINGTASSHGHLLEEEEDYESEEEYTLEMEEEFKRMGQQQAMSSEGRYNPIPMPSIRSPENEEQDFDDRDYLEEVEEVVVAVPSSRGPPSPPPPKLNQNQVNFSPTLPEASTASASTSTLEPMYVNAKQFHRILKRRAARARLEEMGRLSRERKVRFQFLCSD